MHIGYLTIGSGKSNRDVNILVVTDYFTRYAQTFITSFQTAKGAAQTLGEIICVLWFPRNEISK